MQSTHRALRRFSAEDAFRSDLVDLLVTRLTPLSRLWARRGGLPDAVGGSATAGGATGAAVRGTLPRRRHIDFHGRNDPAARYREHRSGDRDGRLLNAAVLGVGERNGIASLSGLIAHTYIHDPELLEDTDLPRLAALDQFVAGCLNVPIPFNAPITAAGAFTHRAGIHTRAVLNNPRAYEILDPAEFGLERQVDLGSRFTGRHAVGQRAATLGLNLKHEGECQVTFAIKEQAEQGALSPAEVDTFIGAWYQRERLSASSSIGGAMMKFGQRL